MASAAPPGAGSSSSSSKSTFVMKRKFRNDLPPVPYDAKCVEVPTDPLRFVYYSTTSLERQHRPSAHPPPDLGMFINLIDPAALRPAETQQELSAEDQAIFAESDAKRIKTPQRAASQHFLKTTYIGHDTGPVLLRQRKTREEREREEEAAAAAASAAPAGPPVYEMEIPAIEQTFAAVRGAPVHPINPRARPKQSWFVLPALDYIVNSHFHVTFSEDPKAMRMAGGGVPEVGQIEHALLSTDHHTEDAESEDADDEGGEKSEKRHQRMAMYVPTDPDQVGKLQIDESGLEYRLVREFQYEWASQSSAFVLTADKERPIAHYLPLDSLHLKRDETRARPGVIDRRAPMAVRVQRRPITDAEQKKLEEQRAALLAGLAVLPGDADATAEELAALGPQDVGTAADADDENDTGAGAAVSNAAAAAAESSADEGARATQASPLTE